jgi:hypothetical protein
VLYSGGKAGKSTDAAEEGGPPVPDVEAVKADMLLQVDRLKKNLAKLRGGEASPCMCTCDG